MASLRDIRTRIASVKSTRQITSAMKMVAAAKLRRATDAATGARPWNETLSNTLKRVAASAGDVEHPLLEARREVKKIRFLLISSDRGLCGGFNANLNRRAEERIRQLRAEGKQVELWTYGKKSRDYFKSRGPQSARPTIEITPAKFVAESTALAKLLEEDFAAGAFDECWLGYNQFKSTLTQIPTFAKVLPISIEASSGPSADYVYEPGGAEILGTLLPMYVRTVLLQAFLETEAGEQAARMTAMDSATRNASDLIDRLTLEYNRSRQAAITKELIEIISGAEAL
ncbi:MAG: ATP synthase F1 subunit gamma [Myxococcota bacterium]